MTSEAAVVVEAVMVSDGAVVIESPLLRNEVMANFLKGKKNTYEKTGSHKKVHRRSICMIRLG